MKYERVSYKYRLLVDEEISFTWRGYAHDGQYLKMTSNGLLMIKAGYMWDGPSGPTIDTESFMRASLVHDALYQLIREGVLPIKPYRKRADVILATLAKQDGMPFWRRWYVYQSVRWFGEGSAT